MNEVGVDPRVTRLHPELSDNDVIFAWEHSVKWSIRQQSNDYVAIGFDEKGRTVEMVAARMKDDTLLIYHARTPATRKFRKELGLL